MKLKKGQNQDEKICKIREGWKLVWHKFAIAVIFVISFLIGIFDTVSLNLRKYSVHFAVKLKFFFF